MEKLELSNAAIAFNALPKDGTPIPFGDLANITGLDREALLAALVGLSTDGSAEIDYGRGWHRTPSHVRPIGGVRGVLAEDEAAELLATLKVYAEAELWDERLSRAVELAQQIFDSCGDTPVDEAFAAQAEQTNDARVNARAANPKLSVFDTGEMLEPQVWPDASGKVDFDDDASNTELTLWAHPSLLNEDTAVVQIESNAAERLHLIINGETVFLGEVQ